jgi:D-glycero-alpha-D-manno-heptose-7-phosphate kinase
MIITRTPFRVSLFGGGTDFPVWYQENEGAVLSFSINKYCYITARELPPFFQHRYRIAYSKVETVSSISEIQHPAVRESVRRYKSDVGLEIHHDGDLPARSGVGSSSAFAVGIIHALKYLSGEQNIAKEVLAKEAIHLEQEILRENVGSQDQIACSFGGINFITFGPKSDKWKVSKLELPKNRVEEIESRIALIYSGVSRTSSDISSGLLSNLRSRESLLLKTKELAEESRSLIESKQELDGLGELLDISWKLKQELNPLSVNAKLSQIYEEAKRCGALGGKILGAGGGGFLLFWLPSGHLENFRQRLGTDTLVPIRIDYEGSVVIYQQNAQSIWK